MPALTLPPFPEDVLTHPLLVIDYELIKARDRHETDRLWQAATKLGFWYLKNHGVTDEVDGMFEMGAETMALPLEEKMKFEQGDDGMSFGYKAAGANAVDATGRLDTVEFINVAKDDAFAWPKQARRSYPSTVNARMESTITPFIRKSVEINNTLLDVLNDRLGLPQGTPLLRHKRDSCRILRLAAILTLDHCLSSITDLAVFKSWFRVPKPGNTSSLFLAMRFATLEMPWPFSAAASFGPTFTASCLLPETKASTSDGPLYTLRAPEIRSYFERSLKTAPSSQMQWPKHRKKALRLVPRLWIGFPGG